MSTLALKFHCNHRDHLVQLPTVTTAGFEIAHWTLTVNAWDGYPLFRFLHSCNKHMRENSPTNEFTQQGVYPYRGTRTEK